MSDALKQQAVVRFYVGTETPILKWNNNEWAIEGDREDAELLAESINKLIALTTLDSIVDPVRYTSGWVDDYRDGGHCGCKAEPDGNLVDYHVLESALLLLKQAEDRVQELTLQAPPTKLADTCTVHKIDQVLPRTLDLSANRHLLTLARCLYTCTPEALSAMGPSVQRQRSVSFSDIPALLAEYKAPNALLLVGQYVKRTVRHTDLLTIYGEAAGYVNPVLSHDVTLVLVLDGEAMLHIVTGWEAKRLSSEDA